MWFNSSSASWKLGLSRSRRPPPRPGCRGRRLALEQLDDRVLLSNYYAAGVTDLIADISASNTAGGSNTITLTAATSSPYVLTAVNNTTDGATGLPVIAKNDTLSVVGNGDTIDGSMAGFRLFDVAAGASLTLGNLSLQGGLATGSGVSAEGGAIYNQGAVTLNGVTVQENVAQANPGTYNAAGGGIYSGGALTLVGSTVQNNQALGGAGFEVSYPSTPPVAGGNGLGGGIYVAGGTATLTNVTISTNTAQGGQGGEKLGYYPGGVGGNGLGGALEVSGGTVSLTSATLSSNTAQGGVGGLSSVEGGPGGSGFGGALQVNGGTVSVTSATLSSGTAQGGNGGGNTEGSPEVFGGPGNAFGGALQVAGGTVTLSSDSITSSVAQGGDGFFNDGINGSATEGYYLGNGFGGGLEVNGGMVTLTSDSVSGNGAGEGGGIYNAILTNLTSAINATQTTIAVASASLFVTGSTILVDSEAMTVTAVNTSDNTLTVVRGIDGTKAKKHASNASIDPDLALDAFTLANVVNNTASSSYSGIYAKKYANIFGTYIET